MLRGQKSPQVPWLSALGALLASNLVVGHSDEQQSTAPGDLHLPLALDYRSSTVLR